MVYMIHINETKKKSYSNEKDILKHRNDKHAILTQLQKDKTWK